MLWRGNAEGAAKALDKLKNGHVEKNAKGQLPVHTRFIMSALFAVGVMPGFHDAMITANKHNISFDIFIPYSRLDVLKNLYNKRYDDSWDEMYDHCDAVVYVGGPVPKETWDMLPEDERDLPQPQKEKRMLNRIRDLLSRKHRNCKRTIVSGDRPMLEYGECVVFVKPDTATKLDRYGVMNHPRWGLEESLGEYQLDRQRTDAMSREWNGRTETIND